MQCIKDENIFFTTFVEEFIYIKILPRSPWISNGCPLSVRMDMMPYGKI